MHIHRISEYMMCTYYSVMVQPFTNFKRKYTLHSKHTFHLHMHYAIATTFSDTIV